MRYAVLAFLSIFVFVGLAILSFGLWQILDATGSSAWPVSQGTVLRSEFLVERETDEQFDTRPDIAYRYRVVGKDIEGETLRKGINTTMTPSETRRWVNEHPVDKKVDVYVDPEDATNTVLEPGIPTEAWFFVGFGAIFTIVPTVIALTSWSAITKRTSDANPRDWGKDGAGAATGHAGRNRSGSGCGWLFVIGFFGIFLSVGLGMLNYAIPARAAEARSVDWPSVEGVVIYRGVEHTTSEQDNRTKHTYTPKVVYDYVIDDVTYTSEGITLSDAGSDDRGDARKAIQPYPKGKAVEVFYDPTDLYNGTLKTGRSGGSFVLLILGYVFSAVGGLPIVGIMIFKLFGKSSISNSADDFVDTEDTTDAYVAPWDRDD